MRIPARVKQNENWADVVARAYREKLVEALLESVGVLLPQQVVEENAHGIHADRLRPAELLVDLLGIEGCGLPHLQLVDRVVGNEVAAHQPRLLLIPRVGLFNRPALALREQGCSSAE